MTMKLIPCSGIDSDKKEDKQNIVHNPIVFEGDDISKCPLCLCMKFMDLYYKKMVEAEKIVDAYDLRLKKKP